MKDLNLKTLNFAQVKSHLSDNGLISLGFMGDILDEEKENCLNFLRFENHSTIQNGQEFNLVGVSTKYGIFLQGFVFMGENIKTINQGEFDQYKTFL